MYPVYPHIHTIHVITTQYVSYTHIFRAPEVILKAFYEVFSPALKGNPISLVTLPPKVSRKYMTLMKKQKENTPLNSVYYATNKEKKILCNKVGSAFMVFRQ